MTHIELAGFEGFEWNEVISHTIAPNKFGLTKINKIGIPLVPTYYL